MPKKEKAKKTAKILKSPANSYQKALSDIKQLVQQARYASARSVNAIMTAAYWEIGRRIVQVEQKGKQRADYGERVIRKMAQDLTKSLGKGFSFRNLNKYRKFYLAYSHIQKVPTVSALFKIAQKTVLKKPIKPLKTQSFLEIQDKLPEIFPLPWSAYVQLLSVQDKDARKFYEEEALRNGWSVRQLARQINTLFFQRTMLSRNKTAMLTKGAKAKPGDKMTPEEAIKDPYVLEFLNLKDEYSETELEKVLIQHLQDFLLELGGAWTFIGKQKRLRVGDQWFRVDLVFFHRILKCLVIIDLKTDKFTHSDAGQMNMYLNYAEKHWTNKGENPPIGLILCAGKDNTVVEYTLKGLSKKIMTADYKDKLPSKKTLIQEIEKTKKALIFRKAQFEKERKITQENKKIQSHKARGRKKQ